MNRYERSLKHYYFGLSDLFVFKIIPIFEDAYVILLFNS